MCVVQAEALPAVWSDCLQSRALVQLAGAAGESPRADAHPPVLQTSLFVPQSIYLAYGHPAEITQKGRGEHVHNYLVKILFLTGPLPAEFRSILAKQSKPGPANQSLWDC